MVDAQVVMVETVQVEEAVVLLPAHRGSFASSQAYCGFLKGRQKRPRTVENNLTMMVGSST